MNGREVFKFASRVVGQACRQALGQANMTFDDVDWIIPHQANLRIIQAAAREMNSACVSVLEQIMTASISG